MDKRKYISEVKQTRIFSGAIETTLQIARKSKHKQIDTDEVHSILTGIQKSLPADAKIMVRAMNAQRFFTFKSFADDELNIEDFESYYENKIIDTDKFEKFSFIQITALVNKPKNKLKNKKIKK